MKVNKIFLSSLMVSLILLVSGCLSQPQRSPLPQNKTPEDFLSRSYRKASTDNRINPTTFTLLNNDLKNNEVFFAGEIHGIVGNEAIDLELLKYLKKKAGIKYYLSEMGPASAYFFNRYITTGDEKLLNRLYNESAGTVGWTKETYDAWKDFYQFNKSLPPKERIRLIGIDIQHQLRIGVWCLKDLLPATKPPSSIAAGIDKLNSLYESNSEDPKEIRQLSTELGRDLKTQKKVYQSYLGKNLFDFSMAVNNLNYVFNFVDIEQDFEKSSQLRDNSIYNNFLQYYKHLPKGKFYGLWGRPHTYQREQMQINYIASLMNQKNSPVKNKVLSMAIFYKDCQRIFVNEQGAYDKEPYSDENRSTAALAKTTNAKITLFELTGKNSPYERKLYIVDDPTGGGATVDYFQYVFLIKNAGPSKPLANR